MYVKQLKTRTKNQTRSEFNMPIANTKKDLRNMLDKNFHATLLALPTAGIVVGTVIPLVFMILIAFTNYDNEHLTPNNLFTWVGLDNFKHLFDMQGDNSLGSTFFKLLGWTLLWAVLSKVTTTQAGWFCNNQQQKKS